ncbi:hypothetical protein [Longimicrobium terrae]|uniref:VCBS repeat-containing protein n=1 Tax=Longimicrobium terrae TaxID=1639882 RepID=A0A841H3R3_9BACT|nr:hypothetical protein [Longimicrobium terrae]MBB4638292.1 hypothetical protein [Longimicrobium terrae]MBB6072640.1 hypothetical protein [Longimicrobium terrae]NNC28581.1 hypothetical protein [Longimicrobium terrae]
MRRTLGLAAAAVGLTLLAVSRLSAQDWSPPSSNMPQMPAASALAGGWRGELASWFGGLGDLSAVRAMGEGGGPRPRMVRFTGGARPIAQWTDRNGDGKADMIEIYRNGGLAFQVIDADYDGAANVMRVYDARGELAREQRL